MTDRRRRSSLGVFFEAIATKTLGRARADVHMSSLETDLLMSYQLSLQNPAQLGDQAFYEAKIVDSRDTSSRAHAALLKNGVLLCPDNPETLSVDTSKITRHFPNQLPFCSALMHRRIVSMLFVFEEQAMRWRQLHAEEAELRQLLVQPRPGMEAEIKLRLQSVLQKKALLPSQQANSPGSGLLSPLREANDRHTYWVRDIELLE